MEMNGRVNENIREKRKREPDDEGWVYPERMPGGRHGAATGTAYGYDVRAQRQQVASQRVPTTPPGNTPGRAQNRRAAPDRNGGYVQRGQNSAAPVGRTSPYVNPYGTPPSRPMQGQGGRAAPAGRIPAQRAGGIVPPAQGRAPSGRPQPGFRSGIRTTPDREDGKRRIKLIAVAALVVAAVILAIVLISKHNSGSRAAEPAETVDTQVETVVETEAPPEPEPPKYAHAARTAQTVQLGTEISCEHAILIDLESNTVIAEKGGDDRIFPASMTKVLTALTAVDKCNDLEDTFVMTNEIVASVFEANATNAGFVPGEVLTVRDLLYGALLPSGADGTRGLAEYTSGTEAAFAEAMNAKCAELGLTDSHFSNASGLHADDHYSTCHDIAVIMEAAMDDPEIAKALGSAEYVTSKTAEHPDGIELHHTLLFERLDGSEEFDGKIEVIGGKTGFTDEAGNCLVTMARVVSTGKRYIFVCAGGNSKWPPVFDTIHVYRNYLGEKYDGEFIPKSQR